MRPEEIEMALSLPKPRRSKRALSRAKLVLAEACRAQTERLESRHLMAETAGALLVDVNATTLVAGTVVTNLPNAGTLGGTFEAIGGADQTPVIGHPVATATSGTVGIRFDGNDFLRL